jgi:hypothetical protein
MSPLAPSKVRSTWEEQSAFQATPMDVGNVRLAYYEGLRPGGGLENVKRLESRAFSRVLPVGPRSMDWPSWDGSCMYARTS